MPFLTAAVVLVGVLCLINLLVSYGVIRRLREHAALLASRNGVVDDSMAPVGSTVAGFAAIASDGTAVDPTSFAVPTLVGFFAPGCPACEELLPAFLAIHATGVDADGRKVQRVLAVVTEGQTAPDYAARLSGSVPVVGGEQAQRMAAAFGVRGYPCVCVVDPGGVIAAVGTRLVSPLRVLV